MQDPFLALATFAFSEQVSSSAYAQALSVRMLFQIMLADWYALLNHSLVLNE